MARIQFYEEQKFTSPILVAIMCLIYSIPLGLLIYGNYTQFVLGQSWGNKPMTDSGLLVLTVCLFIVLAISAYLLFGSKLETTITADSLTVRFRPFFSKPIIYKPADIQEYEVRKYSPIKEYGGWGIKVGLKNKGKAYNVKGNLGLQLYLTNGKKVLIGTQRKEAISSAMRKMMGK